MGQVGVVAALLWQVGVVAAWSVQVGVVAALVVGVAARVREVDGAPSLPRGCCGESPTVVVGVVGDSCAPPGPLRPPFGRRP